MPSAKLKSAMNHYQYSLEKGSKKHICPQCEQKRFVRYINIQTNEYLPHQYGRCDREVSCGYHLNPYQNRYDKPDDEIGCSIQKYKSVKQTVKPPPISLISTDIVKQSRVNYHQNYFIQYLLKIFDIKTVERVIEQYHIGTSRHWKGATVFWQIDTQGEIRSGKVMLYNPQTGKRAKKPYDHITWMHCILKIKDFNLQQCFFGEHLLAIYPNKPVAIVESEKTACIASIYYPPFVWLAAGSVNNISAQRCQILKRRNVFLFPDLKCFDQWSIVANKLAFLANFTTSNILEQNATLEDREEGLDLADYLTRYPYESFQQVPTTIQKEEINEVEQERNEAPILLIKKKDIVPFNKPQSTLKIQQFTSNSPAIDENELIELEQFFQNIALPEEPLKLDNSTTVSNIPEFVSSHLTLIRANRQRNMILPYVERLLKLKKRMADL